ncbi:hypothetical protein A2U01_0112080, partial [Trifolium medium]|nr:hypothetical protein [Trifolium medium]
WPESAVVEWWCGDGCSGDSVDMVVRWRLRNSGEIFHYNKIALERRPK